MKQGKARPIPKFTFPGYLSYMRHSSTIRMPTTARLAGLGLMYAHQRNILRRVRIFMDWIGEILRAVYAQCNPRKPLPVTGFV
jgi:hypothetical protein